MLFIRSIKSKDYKILNLCDYLTENEFGSFTFTVTSHGVKLRIFI